MSGFSDSIHPGGEYKFFKIKELHPTFGAEITGVDFSKPVADDVFAEIMTAITKYGVVVFRKTGLDDKGHVDFAAKFGELDDVTPYLMAGRKNRFDSDYLFDVSNQEDDGTVAPVGTRRYYLGKGNQLFHVDSSFNPRRAGYSLLKAHQLPPPGSGGNTEYADTRSAFADLPEAVKKDLIEKDYIAGHCLWHSRKLASPVYFADVNPTDHFMSRHRLVQLHEPSGRMNLYIASHAHHLEGMPVEEGQKTIRALYEHASQEKYQLSIPWVDNGDLVLWDNTCVMHRSTGGSFEGKYIRDMRRATVHDGSSQAWGLNEKSTMRAGLP